jgi:Family of unknown function (DUF6275)
VEVAYIVKIEVPVNSMLFMVDKMLTDHMKEFNSRAEVARHFVLPREDEMPGQTPQLPDPEEEEFRRLTDLKTIVGRFRQQLEGLINENSMENWSNTPDFILAQFLTESLKAFDNAVRRRDEWYLGPGRRMEPAQERTISEIDLTRGSIGPDKTGMGEILSVNEEKKTERILPVYNFVLGQEMQQAVHQAIGRASVCWEPMDCTGIFDTETASQLGKELMEIIVDYAQQYAKDKAVQLNSNAYQAVAKKLVYDYVQQRLDKSDPPAGFTIDSVFVTWFSKTLQNWKAMVSTTLPDGMYYEVTFNGDKNKAYVDAYRKVDNIEVSLGQDEEVPAARELSTDMGYMSFPADLQAELERG